MDPEFIYKKVLKSLNVQSKNVSKKAIIHCRTLDYRQPSIPNADLCKYHICVEIAHKQLDEPFSRELAVKSAGTSQSEYQEAFGTVCAILRVTFSASLADLARAFGMEDSQEYLESIIEHFKLQYESRHIPERRADIEHNQTLLNCCGLILAAEVFKKTIDVPKMLQMTSIPRHLLNTQLKQVRELTLDRVFPSGVPQAQVDEAEVIGSAPSRKKQKGATGAIPKVAKLSEETIEKPPRITLSTPVDKSLEEKVKAEDEKFVNKMMKASILAAASTALETQSQSQKIQEEEERYRKWRETVIEKTLSSPKPESSPSAPKKQSTINFLPQK